MKDIAEVLKEISVSAQEAVQLSRAELLDGEIEQEEAVLKAEVLYKNKKEQELICTVPCGQIVTGRIMLFASDHRAFAGIAVSGHRRVLLSENEFVCKAGGTYTLSYAIDAKGLAEHTCISTEICLISSLGESRLPVRITGIEETKKDRFFSVPLLGSGNTALNQKHCDTLEEFAQLAKENAREALLLYSGKQFEDLLQDEEQRALYLGLSRKPVLYQHMENFLVQTGQKDPVRFSLQETEGKFEHMTETQKGTLYIYRHSFGYFQLEVHVEGDFIHLSKKSLSDADFVGKVCALDFEIDPANLTEQERYGKIVLDGGGIGPIFARQKLVYSVSVSGTKKPREVVCHHRTAAGLARERVNYLLGKQSKEQWIAKSEKILLGCESKNSMEQLSLAFLQMEKNDRFAALEALWPMKEGTIKAEGIEQYAAYLFMAKELELLPEEMRGISARLSEFARKHPESYLLMRLSAGDAFEQNEQTLKRLEDCFEAGCRSPFLYIDAWRILAEHENLLRKLTPFMIRVFSFIEKNEEMEEHLLLRFAFLSHNLKRFDRSVLRILEREFEKRKRTELLEAICALIVKGRPVKKEYFRYYSRAIEADLRIVHVFEYYLETIDFHRKEKLPLPVLLYFSGNEIPGDRKKAFVYANILRNEEKDGPVFSAYEQKIRAFASEALAKGLFGEDYAELYAYYYPHASDGRVAAALANIIFRRKFSCDFQEAEKLIVSYAALEKEDVYLLESGSAMPNLYTDECVTLFVEDKKKRRYPLEEGSYSLLKLLDDSVLLPEILSHPIRNTGLLLAGCGGDAEKLCANEANTALYRMAEQEEGFLPHYRQALRSALLTYYLAHPEDMSRFDFVKKLDADSYIHTDFSAVLELFLQEGRYEDVFFLLSEYGYEQAKNTQLLRLANYMIHEKEMELDEELLCLCEYVYRAGCYNDTVLLYLREHFEGGTEALCRLWHVLALFSIERRGLTEKIIRQSVFSGVLPSCNGELLESYYGEDGNEALVTEFLKQIADELLLSDRCEEKPVLHVTEEILMKQENLPVGPALLWLRAFARSKQSGALQQNQSRMELAERILDMLCARGIRFSFYKDLPAGLIEKYQISDKIFIEKRFPKQASVTIWYKNKNMREWMKEPMKRIYHTIFGKELLLFYGEETEYFICCKIGQRTWITPVERLCVSEIGQEGNSRYILLNQMLKASGEKDTGLFEKAWLQYQKQSAFVHRFFKEPVQEGR